MILEDVMTLVLRSKAAAMATPRAKSTLAGRQAQILTDALELVVAPAAIEHALSLYEQLQPHDTSVILQARKI